MPTPNKGLQQPANGADVGTWDVPMNSNFGAIDTALGGVTPINAVGASGTVVLALSQYTPPIWIITGAITANIAYQLPSGVGGRWTVYNNTSGAHAITVTSAGGGSSVTLPQGQRLAIACDGVNVTIDSNAVAAGTNTQIQYNSGGMVAAGPNLQWSGSALQVGTSGGVTGQLDLFSSTTGKFVGFIAPNSANNVLWTLPATDGTSGQFLTTNGAAGLYWSSVGGSVTSFSGGSTGLTPSTATAGAVTLGGVLGVGNGGTGTTSSTGTGALVLSSGATLSSATLTSPSISNPSFSGTISGLPYASQAQVQAGSSTTAIVTPNSLVGQQSLGQNGYITLPGGAILQWKREVISVNQNTDIQSYFPITFPNAVWSMQLTSDSTNNANDVYGPTITAFTTQYVQWRMKAAGSSNSQGVWIWAIGN